jgi:hypothetical protein
MWIVMHICGAYLTFYRNVLLCMHVCRFYVPVQQAYSYIVCMMVVRNAYRIVVGKLEEEIIWKI